MTTGGVQPGHSDAIAFPNPAHPLPDRRDIADAFVTGDEGRRRLHRPVAGGGVQIRVTHTGCHHLHEDLAGADLGDRDILYLKGSAERVDDGGFHHLGHVHLRQTKRVRARLRL